MTRRRRHKLVVEIECLDAQGQRQAQDRLCRWLGAFGHTDCSFGFKFKTVGVMTGKAIQSKCAPAKNHEEESNSDDD